MASFTLTCKDINEHGTEHRVEFDCNDFEDTNSLEDMPSAQIFYLVIAFALAERGITEMVEAYRQNMDFPSREQAKTIISRIQQQIRETNGGFIQTHDPKG